MTETGGDKELVIGNKQLISLFFVVVALCGVFFAMGYMFFQSLRSGTKSPRNPWGSAALEWQTATPPPLANFIKVPTITRGPYDYHLATEEELSET